jgi:hypothetical protein
MSGVWERKETHSRRHRAAIESSTETNVTGVLQQDTFGTSGGLHPEFRSWVGLCGLVKELHWLCCLFHSSAAGYLLLLLLLLDDIQNSAESLGHAAGVYRVAITSSVP